MKGGETPEVQNPGDYCSNSQLRQLCIQVFPTWTAFSERWSGTYARGSSIFLAGCRWRKRQLQEIMCRNLDRFRLLCTFGCLNLSSSLSEQQTSDFLFPIPGKLRYQMIPLIAAEWSTGLQNTLCFIFRRTDRPPTPKHLCPSQWPALALAPQITITACS